jgi:Kef-type K+ transport system membrane component KefB
MTDAGANGALSRTVRDVTILQSVAAILVFIVVLAVARPLASHGAVMPGIAGYAFLVLMGSLLAGAALGLAAAQYLPVIQGRLEWVLLVFAFIVAQAFRLAGLDPVLMALAAGITLRNAPVPFARLASDAVRAELMRFALPVSVVFFALAGSNLRLAALSRMWPWALLFVGLRATGLWAGLRWASRHTAGSSDLVQYGWLGLISQGGLAITLAALLRRAFPEWNISLEALVVAMIGVHQLVGPICFHWVLQRTGEITRVEETHVRESAGGGGDTANTATGGTPGVVASGTSMY